MDVRELLLSGAGIGLDVRDVTARVRQREVQRAARQAADYGVARVEERTPRGAPARVGVGDQVVVELCANVLNASSAVELQRYASSRSDADHRLVQLGTSPACVRASRLMRR